jgi:hypothetical protein
LILSRRPAWPISVLLIGYPLWWALGIGDFIWTILAIPMAMRMIGWRAKQTRSLRVPPAFGLWVLFLVLAVVGGAALGITAPGTAPSPVSHRVLSYLNRTAAYVGITVLLLYAGNLTESELPRRRLAWMLGLVAIYTTVGGVAAIIAPTFQFRSLLEVLLPHSLQSNAFVHAVTHPGLAQVQSGLLGGANKRPKAPFDYTNAWGESLTLLVPWLMVGWWYAGTRRRRILAGFLVVLAAVPLLYSLNRTAWLGAALSLLYFVVRVVAKRPRALVAVLATSVIVASVVAIATPVPGLLAKRVSGGGSASLRTSLDRLAVRDALSSPVIGYGDTRKQRGSLQSVARGPTSNCPQCGQQEVGSTGQLWLLLICNGVVGLIVYVGFFAVGMLHFRRDRTPYGHAGVLVLMLSLLYLFTYSALSAPLGFTMLGYALLWRNELDRRQERARGQPDAWQDRLAETRVMIPELVA